jgi:hypothetical protein
MHHTSRTLPTSGSVDGNGLTELAWRSGVHVQQFRYPKSPCLQRAPSVENLEAPPELKVYVLPEIVTVSWIGFVSGRQATERGRIRGSRLV